MMLSLEKFSQVDRKSCPTKMRLVKREEAPEYLQKPWIHSGYLIGIQLLVPKS